jgi:hypothetical protein
MTRVAYVYLSKSGTKCWIWEGFVWETLGIYYAGKNPTYKFAKPESLYRLTSTLDLRRVLRDLNWTFTFKSLSGHEHFKGNKVDLHALCPDLKLV